MTAGWVAYVDESEPHCPEEPMYVLAAALVDRAQHEQATTAVQELRLPGQRKVHWHDESAARRYRLAAAVADLEVLHPVVVRLGGPSGERSERRRRLCLRRLLYELEQADVDRVIMEARQEQQNRADRTMLDTLRAQKVLTSAVRMEHVRGRDSPMLAIPDIVCGAVTAEQGGVPDYLQALKPLVTLHTLHAVEGE